MNRYRKQLLFLLDSVLLVAVGVFSYYFMLRMVSSTTAFIAGSLLPNLVLLYGCTVVFQVAFHTYDSLWRYAESREYLTLLVAAGCGFFVYEVLNRMVLPTRLPFIYLAAVASLWVLAMLLVRFLYREHRTHSFFRKGSPRIPAAIVGAGTAGVQLLEELQNNENSRYRVVCFFDDDPGKLHKNIRGVLVRDRIRDIPERLKALDVREIFVAIPSITEERRQEILRQLSDLPGVRLSVLPSALELLEQTPIRQQLREVQLEDLLGREPVQLDAAPVDAFLSGKTVLVTGGGGSIGSELCRQIVKHRPGRLVILDIYENNAYDIQQELLYHGFPAAQLTVEIGSIRDRERLEQLFARYRPQVVFHAAAHKHVPLMEKSPREAVRNNVFGTRNLVETADAHGVEKFILISTDKAVNPTSVMGASKRLCEMIVQSMQGRSATVFAAVRFGNVLGSNGSVVPLFRRQIAAGGPVTVTDKRIIRYFMTIPEAAQLVLLAGAMARQNELYVLEMGKPVKILELAENMIRLSGYVPYRDIAIEEVGLRPGEKLYEELLVSSRNVEKTDNDLIYIEHQPAVTAGELEGKLTVLAAALEKDDPGVIRAALHQVLPSFHEPEEVNPAREPGEPGERLG